ncbi:uncharacterized protein LOC122322695 [Drosophila grimshawi]|uniref:uncharacterized protein LOC122322695 n=1 Tax=Drosophila grimshawi TaxID=7222 RepID=UPI001C9365B7|nr:uncharacterized protein LOC122322695 [Drosophila grimshawi]
MSHSLEDYRRQRANIKRNISRIKTLVDGQSGDSSKRSPADLQCRLGILESYFKQSLAIQSEIETLDPNDNGRAELEDNYVHIKLAIKKLLGEDLNSTVADDATSHVAYQPQPSRLPCLALPTFDGNHLEYNNFICSFNQIVKGAQITNIEKFNYLLNCLKGAALECVKAFPVTNENYAKALEKLKSRSLSSLGSGIDIAQAMLIYVVLDKCDQETRNKWNLSLDYTTIPTWDQCVQVLERHCQFLLSKATAMVLVRDSTGTYRLGRALLDSCSQVNLFTDSFAQKLRLKREKHDVQISSTGHARTYITSLTTTSIRSRLSPFEVSLDLCVTSHIAYQPDINIDISTWKMPENIVLADEKFYQSRHIDMLLATEAFFDILSVGQVKLDTTGPMLQKTLFGWVVTGKCHPQQSRELAASFKLGATSIDDHLKRLWEIESTETSNVLLKPEHRACEEHYVKTTVINDSGRIVHAADFSAWNAVWHNLRNFAYSLSEPHYYIPHHCVLKPSSESTKLRVVFDASCRTSNQTSLNDHLLVGPTLQDDLYLLLLRFRLHRYAITADVTKMYRQVNVDLNDRKYQYILWRALPDEPLRTYQLNTVTYGTASAPYLAIRSLHFLANLCRTEYPIGAAVIESSFYVDDLLSGGEDIETLRTIKDQVTKILHRGHFPLSKWHSNHAQFIENVAIKDLNTCENGLTSALGVSWNQLTDMLLFHFNPKIVASTVTKRTILSIASALFDPLGLVSPLIIVAKIILQELWLAGLTWDESVPQHLELAWKKCLESFQNISSLAVPRYCKQVNQSSFQLHGFCDASIRAYGCCIYVRSESACGNIGVHLLTAKSRVAPVKKKSLPKLELCGAHLLAQVYNKIKCIFAEETHDVYLWSDSQIVLHWLIQHSVTLSAFVGNRVSEIQDLSSIGRWRFVPTTSNPADIVSRGATTSDLQSSIWFSGPAFLTQHHEHWPTSSNISNIDMQVINAEQRKSTFVATMDRNHVLEKLANISSYNRCVRTVAYMLRFVQITHMKRKFETTLSSEELRNASYCIIWNIQQLSFVEDQPLRSHLKFLNPFLDRSTGFSLIRVGGRLDNVEFENFEKHPILLPSKSHFVWIYVRHLHLRNCHAGPKALVALLRLEYWIVNARDLARRIVHGVCSVQTKIGKAAYGIAASGAPSTGTPIPTLWY